MEEEVGDAVCKVVFWVCRYSCQYRSVLLEVIARPGSVFARQEKFTPTSPMPTSPPAQHVLARCPEAVQKRNARRPACGLRGYLSQLHAVDNAGRQWLI